MKHDLEANRFKEALNENRLSCAELSRMTGISKSSISHYYKGLHVMSNITAGKIADVLNVSPVWLMGFDVPKEKVEYKDDIKMTTDMIFLLETYSKLNEVDRKMCLNFAKRLLESYGYEE